MSKASRTYKEECKYNNRFYNFYINENGCTEPITKTLRKDMTLKSYKKFKKEEKMFLRQFNKKNKEN